MDGADVGLRNGEAVGLLVGPGLGGRWDGSAVGNGVGNDVVGIGNVGEGVGCPVRGSTGALVGGGGVGAFVRVRDGAGVRIQVGLDVGIGVTGANDGN